MQEKRRRVFHGGVVRSITDCYSCFIAMFARCATANRSGCDLLWRRSRERAGAARRPAHRVFLGRIPKRNTRDAQPSIRSISALPASN